MPQRIIDTHVHTDNSPDGHHSAMYMCECAEMAGLRAIAFTDHVESDAYRRDHYDRVALQSFIDVTKARSAFRGKLLVCAGVELGQPMYDVATSEEILANLPYDMVIGSVHNFQNEQDFMYLDYSQWDITDLMNKYFDELIKLARWAKFDTLAHMTYPLRYIVGEHGMPVDMSKFSDKVDEILSLLVKNEKALEINTSGLRQKLGKTMPEEDVVRRFKQLGGEFVTVGSDAHYAKDIGAGVIVGLDRLFGTDMGTQRLCDIGLKIGSDVPFCIAGGTMLSQHTGGILSHLPPLKSCFVVLAKPATGVSTARAYGDFDSASFIYHPNKVGMLDAAANADFEGICRQAGNVFEQTIEVPERVRIKSIMRRHGSSLTQMSGSGPTVFGLFESESDAEKCRAELEKSGLVKSVHLCKTADKGVETVNEE